MTMSLRKLPADLRRSRCVMGAMVLALFWPSLAVADKPRECAEAYEMAQVERKAGHIRAALENLTICASESCPRFLRRDCIQWMSESQSGQPSVVFSVRQNGVELTSVEIACDGRPLTRVVDGKAVALDPGAHRFTFRIEGAHPTEKQIIIREGERNRIVEVDLDGVARQPGKGDAPAALDPAQSVLAPLKSADAPPAPSTLSAPVVSYGLVGLGVLGVSGFAVFGLWGNSQKDNLERTCSPFCRSSQVDEVHTKYIVADTCLAVGLVSLGLATYRFVANHETAPKPSGKQTSVAVSPSSVGRGGVVNLWTSF